MRVFCRRPLKICSHGNFSSAAARSLAVAEALVGQLHLAILIASLVGMALQAKSGSVRGSPVHSDTGANKNADTRLLLHETLSPEKCWSTVEE